MWKSNKIERWWIIHVFSLSISLFYFYEFQIFHPFSNVSCWTFYHLHEICACWDFRLKYMCEGERIWNSNTYMKSHLKMAKNSNIKHLLPPGYLSAALPRVSSSFPHQIPHLHTLLSIFIRIIFHFLRASDTLWHVLLQLFSRFSADRFLAVSHLTTIEYWGCVWETS